MNAKSDARRDPRQPLLVPAMLIIGLGIALLLTVGHYAQAAAPAGPAAPMGACDQRQPAMVYNSTTGEYLVVWMDLRTGTGADIYGQRVSSSGALVGSNFPISAASALPSYPSVTYNSTANAYLVIWQDYRNGSTTDYDIYGQRVSSGGALVGSEIPISTASQEQENPRVAYSSDSNEYMAVWRDRRNDLTTGFDIYGQRVSSGGALAGSNFPIATESAGEGYPTVAYSSDSSEYLVAWEDNRETATNLDISGQRVSSSGALVGSKIPIAASSTAEYRPALAYNGTSDEYLVVWYDTGTGTDNVYVYGQRVSDSGALVGSSFPIPTASGQQFSPTVAFNNSSNQYLVVWTDRRNGVSNQDIYGQRVSGSGALVGSEIPIATSSLGEQVPVVAYSSAGSEYLVAWWGPGIYRQRVSGTGTLLGSNAAMTDCGVAGTATPTPPPPATATPHVCTPGQFSDVPPSNTFYPYVTCLADRGIIGGYSDCTFRPNANVTRGQLSKIVANSAGFNEPVTGQTFQDVPSANAFYPYVERMASRGIIGGYNCGGAGEPCGSGNKPYFRPNANATRGQISKIVSNAKGYNDPADAQLFQDVAPGSTFHEWVNRLASRGIIGGYPCGGAGEPCGSGNLPYFRPANNATRGQTSKVVAGAFFPECEANAKR